jgi:hypothetical protein
MLKKLAVTTGLIFLLGAGCVPTIAPIRQVPTAAAPPSWQEIGKRVERYDCPAANCGVRLIMYRFPKDAFVWRFAESDPPATIKAWASSLPDADFVANGLFFDEKWRPTGLMISGNKTLQAKRYDYDKSGLLELAPAARTIDTSTETFDLKTMTEAGQSFPLLITGGKAVEAFKDTQAARRTAVGTDADGDTIFAFVPEDAITFVDFAKLLSSTDVKWQNVLNLDGGTSTGFSARIGDWSETINSFVQIPNVIIAEKK